MMTNYNRQREKENSRHTPRFCALHFKVSTLVTAAPTSLVYLKLVSPEVVRMPHLMSRSHCLQVFISYITYPYITYHHQMEKPICPKDIT
ncbi:hypothetical protein ACSS6W_008607 [Trichoderma asperelloides]